MLQILALSMNLDELRLIQGGRWTGAALATEGLGDHLLDGIFHLRVWTEGQGGLTLQLVNFSPLQT